MSPMKKCRVCGDRANRFNYDGLTCESCRAFFFRNSIKNESLSCKQNKNCEITVLTRSKCPKCRLDKCFSIGMKRTAPKSEPNDKNNRFDQILEICLLKQLSEYDVQTIAKYVSNETNSQIQNKSTATQLSQYELECISEARKAFGFKNENCAPVAKYAKHISELWDFPYVYIRKTVIFCHNFAVFNSLTNEQQLSILKPYCMNLLSVWFTFQAQTKNNGMFVFSDDSESEAIFVSNELTVSFENQNLAKKIHRFTQLLHNALENDEVLRDLVFALLLFKPNENSYSNENIRYHYHLYSMLIRRYLQRKHQNRNGNLKYNSMMRLMEKLDAIQKIKLSLIIEFGLEKVPWLIKELFSLV